MSESYFVGGLRDGEGEVAEGDEEMGKARVLQPWWRLSWRAGAGGCGDGDDVSRERGRVGANTGSRLEARPWYLGEVVAATRPG